MRAKIHRNSLVNSNSSVFIATFSLYKKGKRLPKNGMIEPLLSFFAPLVKTLLLLDQPHPLSDIINPLVEKYEKGKSVKKYSLSAFFYFPLYLYCRMERKGLTRISYKLRDFFSVILIALSQKENYDLFIGLEAINALAGILLRGIRKVKRVVYYVSDYSPTRFGKGLLNNLYLWLDRFCVKHADFTWDVSPAMKKGRIESGFSPKNMSRVLHVPNALFPSQIESLPISKRIPDSLVYLGTLDSEFGVDLAIKSLKIVKNIRPDSVLHVIGGGKNIFGLKMLVKKLNLENSVIFYGYVVDSNKMAKIVRTSYVGLAPYRAFKDSFRWYGDAGKIRQYLASGLPVVTTQVPPLGRHIVEQGAGIMTKDTVKSFSDGIMRLLLDDGLYRNLAAVAKKISQDNTWENVYTKTFADMENLERGLIETVE